MRLSEICVKRPVFAFMLVMFLVVMGVFSFMDLGVDLFPRADATTVSCRVRLPGASPEEVTSQVVLPIEEAIASVAGIDEMRAQVSEGSASVVVTFVLERDINEAANDVREKVAAAARRLPPNALAPVVAKSDPDSDPIITLAMSGQRTTRELTEIADKQIRRTLETVDGVAAADISGGQLRQINVFLDLDKMSGYRVTALEVQRALQNENVETPGGRIVRGANEMGVRTLGRVEDVGQFSDIIIKSVAGAPIRIRDLGYVEDGTQEKRSFAVYNGKPAVIVEVRRQIGTNTVQVVQAIKAKLAGIEKELPPGVKIEVLKDQAMYIKASVAALEEHLVIGSLLASVIVWLFIRNWRMVLISSIAIPTSIITTFTLLRAMDFTLNSMTLLGLTLAVGIVIDDAIIVLENIYRHIDELDAPPMRAAVEATQEISLAVLATTISLVVIFVPIAFMTGYARRFVNQFGWTMACSILVSMLVAFTLTPTLSARLLKKNKKSRTHREGEDRGFFDRIYKVMLLFALRRRWVIMTTCALVFASMFVVNRYLGHDWMPSEDQNELSVSLEMPEGSSLAATQKVTLEIADKISKLQGVTAVLPGSGGGGGGGGRVTMANITVFLKGVDERPEINQMAARLRTVLRDYPITRPRINFPNSLGGRDSFAPIRGQLLGPDIKKLAELAKNLSTELMKVPSVADVKAQVNLSTPELQVEIDRTKASDLGVRVTDIATAVRGLMSGEDQISTYKEGSEQYPVAMRLLPGQRDDPNALARLLVPSSKLGLIRLDSVADLKRGLGPSQISRYNRQFAVSVMGNVAPGHSLNEAAADTQKVVDEMGMPAGYQLKFSGQVKILEETTTNMILAISLASIFMYMVLAAQFESFVHPFIIMFTLPLALPFALLSLIATGRSLNLFSALGVLLLLGIVSKNGILQIDYMNQLRAKGIPLHDAIVTAARVRLRPILMTTFSIVAGLIPTALGVGAGASQRSAIAVTIIGGQTLCLLLTLLVVPVGYSLVEGTREWIQSRKGTMPVSAPAVGD